MLLLIPTSVLGAESQFTCVNDNDLNELAEFTINGNPFTINETVSCPYGCSDDFTRCKPAPFISNIVGFSLIFAMSFLMFFILKNVTKATSIMFFKATLIPIILMILGFVDIFSTTMRTIFILTAVLSLVSIFLTAKFLTQEKQFKQKE